MRRGPKRELKCIILIIIAFLLSSLLLHIYINNKYVVPEYIPTRNFIPYSPTKYYNHYLHDKFDKVYHDYIRHHNRTLKLEKQGILIIY